MTSGRSHVSLTTLLEGNSKLVDQNFLWSALHQASGTLLHLMNRDHSVWETGPSLLITPDTLLLYSSGSVLFCSGIPDDPGSDFSPPELTLAPLGWNKTTVMRAYVYSLGSTLCHAVDAVEIEEDIQDLTDIIREMTSSSPFDRPQVAHIVKKCRLRLGDLKPPHVVGKVVRQAVRRNSNESFSSLLSSSDISLSSSHSNTSIQSHGRRDSYYSHLRRSSHAENQVHIPVLFPKEWRSMENVTSDKGLVLPTPPSPRARRRSSIHGSYSRGFQESLSTSASQTGTYTPGRSSPGEKVIPKLSSKVLPLKDESDSLPASSKTHGSSPHIAMTTERTILPSMSASMEKINSIRRSSGGYSFGKDFPFICTTHSHDIETEVVTANQKSQLDTLTHVNLKNRDSVIKGDVVHPEVPPTSTPPPEVPPTSTLPPEEPPTSTPPPEVPPTSTLPPEVPPTSTLPPEELPTSTLPPEEPPTSTLPPEELPTSTLPPEEPPTSTLPPEELPTSTLPPEELPTSTLPPEVPPTSTPPPEEPPTSTLPPEEPPTSTLPPEELPTSTPPPEVPPTSTPPPEVPPTSTLPPEEPPTSTPPPEVPSTSTLPPEEPPTSTPPPEVPPTSTPPPEVPPTSVSDLLPTSRDDSSPLCMRKRGQDSPTPPPQLLLKEAGRSPNRPKRSRDVKVEFVLTKERKKPAQNIEKVEDLLMTQEDSLASGGISFSLWEAPTTPPPLPTDPPPLFTPYRTEQESELNITEEVFEGEDMNVLDEVTPGEEDVVKTVSSCRSDTPPPLPTSLPPASTPTRSFVGQDQFDEAGQDSENTDGPVLGSVSHEPNRDSKIGQPPQILAGDSPDVTMVTEEKIPPVETGFTSESVETGEVVEENLPQKHSIFVGSDVEEKCEIDVDNSGIYSRVLKRPGTEVPPAVRKSSVSKYLQMRRSSLEQIQIQNSTTKEGDYAIPADVMKKHRNSSEAPEGYITYATVLGTTAKETRHVQVKLRETDPPANMEKIPEEIPKEIPRESSEYDFISKRDSVLSDDGDGNLYASVRIDRPDLITSISSGPYETIREEPDFQTNRRSDVTKDKVAWLLGPDYSRLHKSTSIIISDKSSRSVSRGRRVVSVVLLDSRMMELLVEHDSTGRDIHDQVSAALSLDEPYLFGLAIVKGPAQEEYFLELNKKLEKYAPKNWVKRDAPPPESRNPHSQPQEFIVLFRIMYYVSRNMIRKVSSTTRYHLSLQVRKDLLSGRLYASHQKALILGGLLAAMMGASITDATDLHDYLPDSVIQTAREHELINELTAYKDSVSSLSREEIRILFLIEASTLDDYGVIYYGMATNKLQPLGSYLLGISIGGVTIQTFSNGERLILTELSWKDIDNVYFKNRKFVIEPHDTQTVVLYGGDYRRARYLWNLVVLFHRFSVFTRQRKDIQSDVQHIQEGVKFVHLLKRQGHGVGLRIGSNASGVFIKHIHKDGTADIDGQLEIGDRVVRVNEETVQTHHQASGLIKSSPPLVSLLVEKLTADQRPLASELEGSMEVVRRASSVIVTFQPFIPEETPHEESQEIGPTLETAEPTDMRDPPIDTHPQTADGTLSIQDSHVHTHTPPPRQDPSSLHVTNDDQSSKYDDFQGSDDRRGGEPLSDVVGYQLSQDTEGNSPLSTVPELNNDRTLREEAPIRGERDLHANVDSDDDDDEIDTTPQEKTIYITRHPRTNVFGVMFKIKDRRVVVKSVDPTSPAASRGLKVDQVVISINDTPVQGRPLIQIMDILGHSLASAKLVVQDPQ